MLPAGGSRKNAGYKDLVSDLMLFDEPDEQKQNRAIDAIADYELSDDLDE